MTPATISLSASAAWWLSAGQIVLAAVVGWAQIQRKQRRGIEFRWASEFLVFDLINVFIAFDNLPRLLSGDAWSPLFPVTLLSCRIAWGSVFGRYWPDVPDRPAPWVRWGPTLGFLFSALWLGLHFSPALSRPHLLAGGIAYSALVIAAQIWRCLLWPRFKAHSTEELRWLLLLAVALVLTHAWFSPGLVGTGDAQLYFQTLQDFLNQLRAGIWPPWVSQSEMAPFGAVFPFRFATYHYYFCTLLDVLTARQLTTYALQHLSIILSFIAGGWTSYGVLRRLRPKHPWLACSMAVLYVASPAWLGPLIGFTMIFTVMTLPWVPLALAGAWPEFGAKNTASAIGHGAALAAVWHAHPPVGFWVSVSAIVAQLAAAALAWPGWKTIGRQGVAWLVCGALCIGLWYSTLSLHYSQSQSGGPNATHLILAIMREAFPATILPASRGAAGFADIQLGYSLWIALAVALAVAFQKSRKNLVWLPSALLLTALILPFPWITEHLWLSLPEAARAISGTWPVQRLIGPLAGTIILAGMLALADLSERSRRWQIVVAAGVCGMLLWSAEEASKYLRRGYATVTPAALSAHLSLPENNPLIGNWLAFHDRPIPTVYFANEFFDARLFNRVWSEGKNAVLVDNYESVTTSPKLPPPVPAAAEPLAANVWRLLPGFAYASGARYLLELTPGPQTTRGTFIISAIEFQRIETSLRAGGPVITLPIWSTTGESKFAEMVYLPSDPAEAAKRIPAFLSYRLIPYDPATLPVRIDRFAPYRATLNLAKPGWLETHRFFTPGYRARIGGQPAEIAESDDRRVMIRVPAGSSQVQLDYVGTPLLRATYGVMAAGWLALAIWGVARLWRLVARRDDAGAAQPG